MASHRGCLSAGSRSIPGSRNGGDDDREDHRFDEAIGDVFHLHTGLDAVKIRAGVHAEQQHPRDIAADDPDDVEKGCKQGKLMIDAAILGLIRYRSGSMCIVLSASICSDMRWLPISAVMADPARAVIMMAVSTGPSSRISERNQGAEGSLRAERHQRVVRLQAQHHSRERAHQHDDEQGAGPDQIELLDDLENLLGRKIRRNAREKKMVEAPRSLSSR